MVKKGNHLLFLINAFINLKKSKALGINSSFFKNLIKYMENRLK